LLKEELHDCLLKSFKIASPRASKILTLGFHICSKKYFTIAYLRASKLLHQELQKFLRVSHLLNEELHDCLIKGFKIASSRAS
jgi:hypothetical protein